VQLPGAGGAFLAVLGQHRLAARAQLGFGVLGLGRFIAAVEGVLEALRLQVDLHREAPLGQPAAVVDQFQLPQAGVVRQRQAQRRRQRPFALDQGAGAVLGGLQRQQPLIGELQTARGEAQSRIEVNLQRGPDVLATPQA